MNKKHIVTIYKYLCYFIMELVRLPKIIKETKNTQTPVTLKIWFMQRVLGFNRKAYWPVHFTSDVGNPANIYAGIDVSPGYSRGCYIQGAGKTYIGDYTQIGPNVGIISANHDLYDSRKHNLEAVHIGKYCWIGMSSVILPNVNLGDFTIVAAGSTVTKSFSDGYCIIAGNPAVVKKYLDKSECREFKNRYEYNGYIQKDKFDKYREQFHILSEVE